MDNDTAHLEINRNVSLLDQHAELKRRRESEQESLRDKRRREESKLLETVKANRALAAASELAKGIKYTKPLQSSWRPPRYIEKLRQEDIEKLRAEHKVIVEGDDIPPPVESFKEMKFPSCILRHLEESQILEPNVFQIHSLPVLLSGRDMIGLASTGFGKTLVFVLPLVMFCLEQELGLPFEENEGPYGLILCPSRDLAQQTYDCIQGFLKAIEGSKTFRTQLRASLMIGGQSKSIQLDCFRRGCHIAVATPGRLLDFLKSHKINMDICRYFCLDEADRMLEEFEDEIREVLTFFNHQRQTIFFSATMPMKIESFALSAMVKPIVINVSGRAGAVNKDIKQDVEYVKQEARLAYLLPTLEKTGPPVMIFAKRHQDVDDIHEYLLMRGISAAGIHGKLPQQERTRAIEEFRNGQRDILVASDVVSKGLHIEGIKHVINYDMPEDIKDYTHRVGRTGRQGNKGLATTFINKTVHESTLLDLKGVLMEAGQRVPPFLSLIRSDVEHLLDVDEDDDQGCAFCGGLGHRITMCPKLEANQAKQQASVSRRDFLAQGGADY
ncbi:putative ATP-dependent RNA helicase DDX41, partial [Fragariocoptes setiger]